MIAIREFQHFLYCPHRWGMLHILDFWKENAFTVLAEIKHERVHLEKTLQKTSKKVVFGGVMVYSNKFDIYGKCDALEFVKSEKGVYVKELDGKFDINIIEYKPTMPKNPSQADRVQLYAQYLCVKEIFEGEPSAFLYYTDVRRRVQLEFNEADEIQLRMLSEQIKLARESGVFPNPVKSEKCNGCSVVDDCMPKARNVDVKKMILEGV